MAAKSRWEDDASKKTWLHFAWMDVPDAHYPRRLLFGDDDEETGPVAGRSLHFDDDHHFLIEPSPAPGDPEPEKRWIEATTDVAASVCMLGCEPGFYLSGPTVCGEDGLRHCHEIEGKKKCLDILTKLLTGRPTTRYQQKRWMDGQARCVPYHPSSPPFAPPSPPPFAPPPLTPPSTPPLAPSPSSPPEP